MADVILSTVDLDVFGGPASIDVSVDFGQTGDRGSRIWAGPGSPEIYLVGQDIKLYDWYINTVSGIMYQYILQVGSPTWVATVNIVLPQISIISTTTFTTGATTINIPLSSITSDSGVTANELVVRYNIANGANPVASSFSYSITGTYPSEIVAVTINAAQYSGGTWSNLTGSKDVHMLISYIG